MMNRNAIVITAGLENPDKASAGVKYPNVKRIVSNIIAVTSMENISVTNMMKPKNSNPSTSIMSGFITDCLYVVGQFDQLNGCSPT